MGLKIYKKGQGKILRYFAIGSLLALELYGCWRLYYFLERWEFMNTFPVSFKVPLSEDLMFTWRLVVASLAFLGMAVTTYLIVNMMKAVNLLIDTETEVKKVTWPSWSEAVNSSIVVIVFVIILSLFITVLDICYGFIFESIF